MEDRKPITTKHVAGSGLALGLMTFVGVNPVLAENIFNRALDHQAVQFTVAFTAAAWFHRKWVKKDIGEQFDKVVTAVDNLSKTLETRIEKVEDGVGRLTNRVEVLERK